MRKFMGLVAVGLVVTSVGCVDTMSSGYPSTYGYGSSGYGSSGYGYNQPTYYSQPTYSQPSYYQPAPRVVTQTRYVPVPVATPASQPRRLRDSDRDGIPDRYDRDRNGDGIPDRQQRRN